ncbi:unnamed protein product [Eruca vesicaria subsp. sativa]|uniref:Uncharacterized protein n=1 Tax=Eruca vesicaria subsp. sativa TaxID=29727 RepID=A0ABC8KCZ6_ERUVS|nr:unnamed protein product [Eruca vesicaria subsp. sativa]
MSLVWLEAALPLEIIGGMLCIMGKLSVLHPQSLSWPRSTSGTMNGTLLWRDATRKSSSENLIDDFKKLRPE